MLRFEEKWFWWIGLIIVVVGKHFYSLTNPQGADTFSQLMLWTALRILPFVFLFLIFRNDQRIPRKRWILFFMILAASVLAFDPFGPLGTQIFAVENRRPLPQLITRAVTIGHGWMLPLVLLGLFTALLLYKHRRSNLRRP